MAWHGCMLISKRRQRPLLGSALVSAGFTVQEAQRCVRHSHIYIAIDVGECASRCRSLAECAAFSFGKEQCLLFTQANCSMNAKGWLSGVKLTKAEAR